MKFVQNPNLPQADIGLAAVSATYPAIAAALMRLGIECIAVGPSSALAEPVGSHADMLCFHVGGDSAVVAQGCASLCADFKKHGFRVTESQNLIRSPYPFEVGLNAADVGGRLIANPHFLDGSIPAACREIQMVPVHQGYAKCSVAVVDENSLITADSGIAAAAGHAGFDVLQIRPGDILLPGCEYGFLGGACGKIGENMMAFTGKIQNHRDFSAIRAFLSYRRIDAVALSDGPLIDIGGILPLMER